MAKETAPIPIESYTRSLRIPIGSNQKVGPFELDQDVTITVTGKIKSIDGERAKDEDYKGQEYRPAEICIDLKKVEFGENETVFTKMAHKMDADED